MPVDKYDIDVSGVTFLIVSTSVVAVQLAVTLTNYFDCQLCSVIVSILRCYSHEPVISIRGTYHI